MILTAEQQEVGRRNFLKATAALPAAGAFALSRNNFGPLKCGIIGTGGQGGVLMDNCPTEYVHIIAACSIRPDHLERAKNIGRDTYGIEMDTYTDYKQMLERSDIEAVIIATPLWTHAEMAIDALDAGKHVFVEKTMASTIEDCLAMKAAAERNGKNLQIGHQRFYNPIYWKMYRMAKGGILGDIYHIRCQWHRNGNWVRPRWWDTAGYYDTFPEMKDFDPTRWGYKEKDHLCNWRLYDSCSKGLHTELASHMIAITNWLAVPVDAEKVNAMSDDEIEVKATAPSSVNGYGGTYRYKDGEEGSFESVPTPYARQCEDHIYCTYEYPSNLTVSFSSIQTNAMGGYYEMIMGTKGTIILQREVEAMYYPEPAWEMFEAEQKAAEAAAAEGKGTEVAAKEVAAGAAAGAASASRGRDVQGSATGIGAGGGSDYTWQYAYRDELRGFAETIRLGRNNLCDADAGLYAAQAVLGGRMSVVRKKRVGFNQQGLPVDESGQVIQA